ncbi:MAG: hypothetical protein P8Z40_07160 [Chloroflexota bacterium]
MLRKTRFWYRYLRGDLPWDSGITPPEIVTLIEEEGLAPGRSIDLGCGTGTNAVQAGVASRTRFLRGDVTRLSPSNLGGPFDLAVDIGCCHSLPVDTRVRYAQTLRSLVQPGGLYMLYAFRRTEKRPGGLNDDDIEALFGAHFSLNWVDYGDDLAANARSAWYQLQRTAES